jgi:hypothetical protein
LGYKDARSPERTRLQEGFDQLEGVYQTLAAFVNGTAEPPLWVSLLAQFRAALDVLEPTLTTAEGA